MESNKRKDLRLSLFPLFKHRLPAHKKRQQGSRKLLYRVGNQNKIVMIGKTISKFMSDHSEGDHGLEALLDYQLSWVLRMAADSECKPRLKHQCRYILFNLLGIQDSEAIEISKVKVWKQWWYIDLVADIYLVENGEKRLHVLMLENKAYTRMYQHQRDVYPERVKEAYNTYPAYKDYRNYDLHQVIVTCFEKEHSIFQELERFIEKDKCWSIRSVADLPDWSVEEVTESDLFNDFWFNDWKRLTD